MDQWRAREKMSRSVNACHCKYLLDLLYTLEVSPTSLADNLPV